MAQKKLAESILKFSIAGNNAREMLPKDEIVDFFATKLQSDLKKMLIVCEHIEEYEICEIIVKAIEQQKSFPNHVISEIDFFSFEELA